MYWMTTNCRFINNAVGKATRVNKWTFTTKASTVVKKLYTTMVCPTLEYGNAPWIQEFADDTNKLERVQRQATKLCNRIKNLPYEERLQHLKLPSLHYRRKWGDMIQVYKILNGKDRVDREKQQLMSNTNRTRKVVEKTQPPECQKVFICKESSMIGTVYMTGLWVQRT